MKKFAPKVAAVVSALGLSATAFATDCKATYTNCDGIEVEMTWPCAICSPGHPEALGNCAPVATHKEPSDPTSCVTLVTQGCSACGNQQ